MLGFPCLDDVDSEQEVPVLCGSREQSMTQAVAKNLSTGIVSVVLSGRSRMSVAHCSSASTSAPCGWSPWPRGSQRNSSRVRSGNWYLSSPHLRICTDTRTRGSIRGSFWAVASWSDRLSMPSITFLGGLWTYVVATMLQGRLGFTFQTTGTVHTTTGFAGAMAFTYGRSLLVGTRRYVAFGYLLFAASAWLLSQRMMEGASIWARLSKCCCRLSPYRAYAHQGLASRHGHPWGSCILLAGSFTNTSSRCST